MRPLALAAAVLSFAAIGGCSSSRTVPFTASQDIPAAQGSVKARATDNGNTSLDIEVRHLAPPARLDAAASTYVVWVRATGETAAQNIGALRVDNDLKGTLRTVTPLRSFDVFVTAEPGPTATAPAGRQLLQAHVERP